jgi:hypothetical protein
MCVAATATYQIRELFGKRFLLALLIATAKSTHLNLQPDWFQPNWRIPH